MPSCRVNNGITLEYDVRGEGPPILFVMGLGGQLVDWEEEFVDLFVAEGFSAIRFDNRDVGLSTQTDWDPPTTAQMARSVITGRPPAGVGYTVEDMAADAAGLLEHLGIGSAHVVGASMGGMIAQALAIGHPSRVSSLCSIMSNTGDRRHGGIAVSVMARMARTRPPTLETVVDDTVEFLRVVSGEHFDDEATRKLVSAAVARSFTPAGVARQSAAIAASPDRTARLARLDVPTLVIHGLEDPLVKPSGGIATTRAVPDSRLLLFPDMGHDLPRPRWGEVRDAIVANTRRAS